MTQKEHDRIVANCAKFMGFTQSGDMWADRSGDRIWLIAGPALMPDYDPTLVYDPTADTPEGREQANELINELEQREVSFDLEHDATIHKWTVRLAVCFECCRNTASAVGKKWNSALSVAVSELETSKQKERADES